jgi:hypothetical protein
MGIHIAESTRRLAVDSTVMIKLAFDKFGPIQKKNIIKGLRTGVIHGHHESAQIVKNERAKHKLPIAGFLGEDTFCWQYLKEPIPDLEKTLTGALVAYKLTTREQGWRWHGVEGEIEVISKTAASLWSSCSFIKPKFAPSLKKLNFGTNPELEALATGIENGTIKTYDFVLS